jgi:hypothetical protein
VMATADLLVLVLRVLPREICKWLNAEHNLSEKGGGRSGTPGSARGHLGFGEGREPAGTLAVCGETVCDEILERR